MTRDELEQAIEHSRRDHRWYLAVLGIALAALVGVAVMLGVLGATSQRLDAVEALNEDRGEMLADYRSQVDALREQVELCADEPPGTEWCAEPAVPGEEPPVIDGAALEQAAQTVLARVLPGVVAEQTSSAVSAYVQACVASGDCKGEDGETPGPGEVAAAVIAACRQSLDCEATADEVAEAVGAYCSQDSQPCGGRWTEREIYRIAVDAAQKVLGDWAYGREWWCPPEDSIVDDQPFGPCYTSSG